MAVAIRLKKVSDTSKKRYNYRVVVIDDLNPRDGRVIEEIGYYDPAKNPAAWKIDKEKVKMWLKKGAQISPTVKSMVKKIK
jgi:small subunit ribosomal protein S16